MGDFYSLSSLSGGVISRNAYLLRDYRFFVNYYGSFVALAQSLKRLRVVALSTIHVADMQSDPLFDSAHQLCDFALELDKVPHYASPSWSPVVIDFPRVSKVVSPTGPAMYLKLFPFDCASFAFCRPGHRISSISPIPDPPNRDRASDPWR